MNNQTDFQTFYQNHQLKILVSILLITVVGMYLFSFFQEKTEKRRILRKASFHNCGIEYSKTKCVDKKLKTAFFNPNTQKITFVKLFVPVASGTNIYNVDEPLPPNETGTLTTVECRKRRPEEIQLKWCCEEKCFKTDMRNPSEDLALRN